MRYQFTKENMWTAGGFVRESFAADLPRFQAVAKKEFDNEFLTTFDAARAKIKGATGAALRTGAGSQVTARLYASMDKVKPLLDLLEIRLGLVDAKALTVKVKDFGLKGLRDRINARDAEGVSKRLGTLATAIADNQDVLEDKGYEAQELVDLKKLTEEIDDDNLLQNTGENTSIETTEVEDGDYEAFDALLAKVMRTGRLLFKKQKTKRQQYEARAVTKRVVAGEKPKNDPGA
ncbi:hypothetical protein Q5H93_16725 [Hymenobacter sp. ASUV-10]|uniref:Uncharacterized protein n=1 Tax=Hymenobacter aranciens TaxID=3063996 RepID=A0ABT9BDP7_9BACT|nr:hypothetical protein [Hymenobacter sp. ASUV-10]MDO7876391.1 hypothetical protein [Hymenobacter sp. ASUV-10]